MPVAGFNGAGHRRRAFRAGRRTPRAGVIAALLLALLGAAPAAAEEELPNPKTTAEFSCQGITFNFEGFPNLPGNTVKMHIRVDGVRGEWLPYTFDGPAGSYTFPLNLSPGHHGLDGWAKWKTNGFRGGSDRSKRVNCTAAPAFAISKLQEVVGEDSIGSGFTSSPLSAALGQSVRYQIVVSNTGNVPLTVDSFNDARCDPGTITGGPGEAPVAAGEPAVYFCEHKVALADLGEPTYANTVTTTATSVGAEGEGEATTVSASSNTVVVNLLSEPPPKERPPANKEDEKSTQGGAPGQTSQTSGTTAQQGVGAVVAAALPSPVFGRSANLFRVAGVVLIKLPGGKRFLRLRTGTSIPIGTIIDATNGRAELATAADTASHTQETGVFYGGVFSLGQTTLSGAGAGNALTVLKLVGPLPACLVKKFGKKAAVTAARRRTRKLWGQAKGNFRTVGRYAAATVRGTKWLTEDICAGTLIRVVEHSVKVDAFPHNRHFVLGQGRSFIAHP